MPCFYKDHQGNVIGPISTTDARNLVARNVIRGDTPIAKAASGPWVAASRLQGLIGGTSTQPRADTQRQSGSTAVTPAGAGQSSTPNIPASHPAVPAPIGEFASRYVALEGKNLVVVGCLAGVGGLLVGGAMMYALMPITHSTDRHARDTSTRDTDAGLTASQMVSVDHRTDSGAKVARFEAECDRVCSEMMAGYRAVSSSPRDIVSTCSDKLAEIGADQEKRMTGTGVSAGCAQGTLTALGMYGLLAIEAGMRCIGQEMPNGGFVAMIDSLLKQADEGLRASDNADRYWTHVAFIRTFIRLYDEENTFNTEFERELMNGGAHPTVIRELRQIRRNIRDLLIERYDDLVEEGVQRYGPPSS